jgi:hypothetical protein
MSAIGLNLGDHGSTCDQHLTDVSAHIRGLIVTQGKSSTKSGRLTAAEWAIVASSFAFITLWLGISFT